MKKIFSVILLLVPLSAFSSGPGARAPLPGDDAAARFAGLDFNAARKQAELVLAHNPGNSLALFVRMEVAELEAQPEVVLDSALRLCNFSAPNDLLQIASARILQYAGNTRAFNSVLESIRAAARRQSACSPNLALALVTAAADGDPNLELQQTAAAAGILTHWRIAGPFGHYSNADFDRSWPPEADRFSHTNYGGLQSEDFLFGDGVVNLPDYFPLSGVLYAASDMESVQAESAVLQVFSPGPYAVFVDGRLALAHDSRSVVSASTDLAALELNAGKHRVVVKFTPDAAPFRVMIRPSGKTAVAEAFDSGPLRNYIEGLAAYFRDDLPSLQRIVSSDSSLVMQYLRALLFSAMDDHSSEARRAWEALTSAPLAKISLAEIAAGSNVDGSAADYSHFVRELPDSEAAQQAAFAFSSGDDAIRRLVALHPSCSHLRQALKISVSAAQTEDAQKLELQLANCAPDSLDYAVALSAQGRHKEAAKNLQKLLAVNPLHRAARQMLVRELLLDGDEKDAAEQAQRLHEIAPNSTAFAQIAASPYRVLDSSSRRAAGFAQQDQFYLPYRRSGLEIIQRSADRHFSGGPYVTLLFDKVVEIHDDASISIYTHRVTRLLNKEGIARAGEVAIPRGADLLELRTIKGNGSAIEPELVQQKSTISMPALEPGDIIEEEFVVHYSNWDEAPEDAAAFTFGSFMSPTLYSRFVVSSPANLGVTIVQENNVAGPQVEQTPGHIVRVWERNDIAQTAQENDLPAGNELPFVRVARAGDAADRLREDLIAATRIGPQVTRVAQSLSQAGASDFEKARWLYRFVTAKIQSANADWSANNAEDTLLNLEGSRTAALLALARSLGLKAELVLARKVGRRCAKDAPLECYRAPLVRFLLPGKTVDADAESAGVPFGAIPFGLDAQDALLVPLMAGEKQPFHVALIASPEDQKSVADADLFLDENGGLAVDLRVRLGLARAQQVRSILQAANEGERRIFFDQLAARIFPGATQVSGASAHLDDPEQPLELALRCQVPQLVRVGGPWDLDQLAPALGLRELYARTGARRLPLFIDAVLFESTTFHLHLPAQVHARSLPPDFTARGRFGEYAVEFRSGAREVTIRREFRIPAQVISPENYHSFADFARQIEEAERGRIVLNRSVDHREIESAGSLKVQSQSKF